MTLSNQNMMTDESMISDLCGVNTTVVNQDTLLVKLYGSWQVDEGHRPTEDVLRPLQQGANLRKVEFDTRKMGAWNSGLLTFLLNIHSFCAGHNIQMVRRGLPQGVERILSLALAVPERKDAKGGLKKHFFWKRWERGLLTISVPPLKWSTSSAKCSSPA